MRGYRNKRSSRAKLDFVRGTGEAAGMPCIPKIGINVAVVFSAKCLAGLHALHQHCAPG